MCDQLITQQRKRSLTGALSSSKSSRASTALDIQPSKTARRALCKSWRAVVARSSGLIVIQTRQPKTFGSNRPTTWICSSNVLQRCRTRRQRPIKKQVSLRCLPPLPRTLRRSAMSEEDPHQRRSTSVAKVLTEAEDS